MAYSVEEHVFIVETFYQIGSCTSSGWQFPFVLFIFYKQRHFRNIFESGYQLSVLYLDINIEILQSYF